MPKLKTDYYYNIYDGKREFPRLRNRNGAVFSKVNGVWGYDFLKSEVEYKGGGAQNNTNPLASFRDHAVVQIGNDIYDPSYGKIYRAGPNGTINDALLEFQKAAIFGYYQPIKPGTVVPGPDKKLRVPPTALGIIVELMDPTKLQLTTTEIK